MAILYQSSSNVSTAGLTLYGDGVTSSIVVSLVDPPVGLDIKANKPVALGSARVTVIVNGTEDTSFTSSVSLLSGTALSISFNKPLPLFVVGVSTFATASVQLFYGGI